MMSFQVLHAYAFDMLDSHPCNTSEYVAEFSQVDDLAITHDMCSIHAEFHLVFVIPEHFNVSLAQIPSENPFSTPKEYNYDSKQDFLIPPIIL